MVLEIHEKLRYLDDNKQRLILEIINNFLPDNDDEIKPDDLYYLDIAEQDLALGETISHNDIKWKQLPNEHKYFPEKYIEYNYH